MQCEQRSVALLELVDADGSCAFGLCAPLLNTHRESYAQAIEGLRFWSSLCSSMMPLGLPSADFAISMAELQLRGVLVPACESIRVAKFVRGGVPEIERVAALGAFKGCTSVKAKIGRESLAADRRCIDALLSAIDTNARLRLDANRLLSLEACVELVHGIDPSRIEFLEAPLANPFELAALANRTGLPIALDETILEWMRGEGIPESLAFAPFVAAHVVRLSCIGRIELSIRHAALARSRGIRAICSTAYESSFALRAAAIVASQIDPLAESAHGLGTALMYERDLVAPPTMTGERMLVEAMPSLDAETIGAFE